MTAFTEIQNFGWNLITASFLATLVFTTAQGYALYRQNRKILQHRSGKSTSFVFFSYYTFSALAVSIYGWYKHSLALSINGLLGFIALAIIINLLRFKNISGFERLLGLGAAIVIPLIIVVPQKDALFLIFGIIVILTISAQILEIWKNKSSGSVHPGQAVVSIFSSLFWLSYALIVNIWPLKIINSIGLALWLILLGSYFKFKDK